MASEKFYKAWKQIIAKCWSDAAFKKKLLQNPEAILKEHGIYLHNTKVVIHEDKPGQIHLSIPMKPESITEKDMKFSAGSTCAPCEGGIETCDDLQ